MQFTFYKKILILVLILPFVLLSCKGPDGKFKLPGGDARKTPADPAKRVEQNIREGKGFRLNDAMKGSKGGGVFEFASSNGLWKASLDVIDFMPLSSVNYSGGIIVTDWYSDGSAENESVKISIRFLSNEVRSDALAIKVFYKNCSMQNNCKVTDRSSQLSAELTKKILSTAAIYKKQGLKKKKYRNEALRTDEQDQ